VVDARGNITKVSVNKGPSNKEMQVIYGVLEEGMSVVVQ